MSIINSIRNLIVGDLTRELSESRAVLRHTSNVLRTVAEQQARHDEQIDRLEVSLRHIIKVVESARLERDVASLVAESVGSVREQISDLADRVEEISDDVQELSVSVDIYRSQCDDLGDLSDRLDVLEVSHEDHAERIDACLSKA